MSALGLGSRQTVDFSVSFTITFSLILKSVSTPHMMDEFNSVSNEAARDDSNVLLIIVLCILFCFAIRHLNDFYTGETVTLVEEGVWSGRFRHKVEYRMLAATEKDFSDMYEQLDNKEEGQFVTGGIKEL